MTNYLIALGVVLLVLAFAAWAFLPAKYLPANRARHLRVRLHLRLHPGKGFATVFALHLRWGQVTIRDGTVHVRFGDHDVPVPEPLGAVLAELTRNGRTRTATGAPPTTPWLFPGGLPGQPITPCRLGGRLRALGIHATKFRRAALTGLAAQLPAAVLADLLGIAGKPLTTSFTGQDLRAVAAWVAGASPGEAERILLAAGADQWAFNLAEMTSEAQKTVATVRMVMSRALSFMADPALAMSVLPGEGGGFDIPAFLAEAGTLYMIAEAISEDAPVAPLFACMAGEIHYQAAQIGQASASRRLDPPLLMGLDEVTQICPVPLPVWLSDSGGKGIQIIAVAHGEAQLASRWGDHGRQVVLDTCSVKVFLPGVTDTTTLDAASKLCGQASWKIRGHYHKTWHDIATPDMIRQLPAGFALVIRGGYAPVIARLPRAWNNPAYKRARRAGPVPAAGELAPPSGLPSARRPAALNPDHLPDDLTTGDDDTFPWN